MCKECLLIKINNIIEDVKSFSTCCNISDVDKLEEVIVIIGDSAYPQNNKVNPINVQPFGIYSFFSFNEVAFLCNKRTLELYSILSIMLDSMDGASILIESLLNLNLMDTFAKYLWVKKHVLLVNAAQQQNNITALLNTYKNHKVLLCCGQKKYPIKYFLTLNKTKNKSNKYTYFMRVNHPSSKSYKTGYENNCLTYFDRKFKHNSSALSLYDFIVFR